MRGPIKPAISDGARYYDRPVVVRPKAVHDRVRLAVSAAFNGGQASTPPNITVRHDRVRLRWMKPDGKGGLVPK